MEGPRASASSPVRGDLCPAPVSRAGLADRARVLREPRWEALSRCGHSAHRGTQSGWGQSLTLGQFPGRTVPPEHGVSEFASTELSGRNSTHWNVSSTQRPLWPPPWDTESQQTCAGCPGLKDSAASLCTRGSRLRPPRGPTRGHGTRPRPVHASPSRPHGAGLTRVHAHRVEGPPAHTTGPSHAPG